MEIVLAIGIVALAAGGMALGLLFGGKPPRTSCGAAEGLATGRCADCPLRRRKVEGDPP